MIPLKYTMIPSEGEQWGRYNLPSYGYKPNLIGIETALTWNSEISEIARRHCWPRSCTVFFWCRFLTCTDTQWFPRCVYYMIICIYIYVWFVFCDVSLDGIKLSRDLFHRHYMAECFGYGIFQRGLSSRTLLERSQSRVVGHCICILGQDPKRPTLQSIWRSKPWQISGLNHSKISKIAGLYWSSSTKQIMWNDFVPIVQVFWLKAAWFKFQLL